jgi:hypothetical protein
MIARNIDADTEFQESQLRANTKLRRIAIRDMQPQ